MEHKVKVTSFQLVQYASLVIALLNYNLDVININFMENECISNIGADLNHICPEKQDRSAIKNEQFPYSKLNTFLAISNLHLYELDSV